MTQSAVDSFNLTKFDKTYLPAQMQCPVSQIQVTKVRWKYTSLPSGWVIWWQCPSCQNWHVSIIDTPKDTFV